MAKPLEEATSLAPPIATDGASTRELPAHPDPLSLLTDQDPLLAANKRLVFDMWRTIVNAGHVEAADEMLAEEYIQHSPVLPTGRAAFKQVFSSVERLDEVPRVVAPPLVTILAEDDLVVMALREELPEPDGEGLYATTHFNLFRIEEGRLAEHWHSVQAVPGPHVATPENGGPQPVTGARGEARLAMLGAKSPEAAANKKLVYDAWQSAVEDGRNQTAERFLSEDYVEHDPAMGPAFKAFPTGDGDGLVAEDAPLVAVVAQGDLVVQALAIEKPHPIRPDESYFTTWFDMFRIEDGKIAEHWDGAVKPGGSRGPYVD